VAIARYCVLYVQEPRGTPGRGFWRIGRPGQGRLSRRCAMQHSCTLDRTSQCAIALLIGDAPTGECREER